MKIKPSILVLAVLFQLLSLTAFSQKTAGLNSLLNKNSEFIFPQTVQSISTALKVKATFYEDANEEKYAKWVTKSGLELYCSLGQNKTINEMSFDIPDDKVVVVSGLPFNLTMNKTTLQESIKKFSTYGAKTQKLDDGSSFPGGSKLVFKKGKHYTTLLFDSRSLLKSLSITTELMDPAAN